MGGTRGEQGHGWRGVVGRGAVGNGRGSFGRGAVSVHISTHKSSPEGFSSHVLLVGNTLLPPLHPCPTRPTLRPRPFSFTGPILEAPAWLVVHVHFQSPLLAGAQVLRHGD
eukprot:5457574-Alexandrium_andersonii.AAC.1